MRITNSSRVNSYLNDLQGNLKRVDKLHTQTTTGNQISRLSDDPHKAVRIMKMQNEISDVERYNYNIDEVSGWTGSTDGALENLGEVVRDIKNSLVKAGNGTYSQDEINSIKLEVDEKIKQVGEILNSTHGGDYIFGGSVTGSRPVEVDSGPPIEIKFSTTPAPNNNKLLVEVSDGMEIEYNVTAKDLIETKDSKGNNINYFDVLNEVSKAFNETPADVEKLNSELMDKMDEMLKHTLNERTELGAKDNIVTSIRSSNDDSVINMKGALSLTKDVDVAEKYIEYKSAEAIYTAAIQVGAKIITPTIMDYLR